MTTAFVPVLFEPFIFVCFVFSPVLEQDDFSPSLAQDDFSPALEQDFFSPSFEQQAFFDASVLLSQQVPVFLLAQVSLQVLPVFAQTFYVFAFSLGTGASDCAEAVKANIANPPSSSNFLIFKPNCEFFRPVIYNFVQELRRNV